MEHVFVAMFSSQGYALFTMYACSAVSYSIPLKLKMFWTRRNTTLSRLTPVLDGVKRCQTNTILLTWKKNIIWHDDEHEQQKDASEEQLVWL